MFAPDGYVSFEVIQTNIEHINYAALVRMTGANARQEFRRGPDAEQMVAAGIIKDPCNSHFARELMEELLLAKLLEISTPLLCSPAGAVMSVSENFFIHADRLDWVYISWPLDVAPEFLNYFHLNKTHKFTGSSIRQRYCFVDMEMGIVALKNNSKNLYRSASHSMNEKEDQTLRLVKNFIGWSLCWREDDLPSAFDLVRGVFPDEDNKWDWRSFFDGSGEINRSSNERILSELLQAYPDGKTDTWAVVEKKVGYARRSIERALSATGRKDWKLGGGQE